MRNGLSKLYLAAGLLLGGACAAGLFYLLSPARDGATARIGELPPSAWCLGRRSKAERLAYWKERTGIDPEALPAPEGPVTVTYSRDIAPILFEHCAVCHRPGEITPFSVLSYEDVRPWAWVIALVTKQRYMPPWPPGREADASFVGERRLGEEQIALIQRWADEGAAEGDPAELPPVPAFPGGWQLGEPDLIVELPEPYVLPPDGIDVYRNLVLPVPLESSRWVEAVEIRPGSKQIVHHAIMQVDRLEAGRRLDAEEAGMGFGGMDMGPAENPGGHLIGWSPGKVPHVAPEGMAWRVGPGTDLILQLHMLPSGKPEIIEPQVGLFFTDEPATRQPFGLVLRNNDIDIPAGEAHHVVEESLVLPVGIEVLGIYPHAHYLGREIESLARLPDGTTLTLIRIEQWDFGWQDEYRYAEPVRLPAGTELSMRFVFDNSAANPRNPNDPPRRVAAGNRSTDEMAIIVYQVLPEHEADELVLREAVMRDRLQASPEAWYPHNMLGIALRAQGKTEEAIFHFREAHRLNPDYNGIVFNLGNAYQDLGDLEQAIRYYRRTLELEPEHPKAHNNLAIALHGRGEPAAAIEHYEAQLALSPANASVHFNLAIALLAADEPQRARRRLERALELDDALAPARVALADVLRASGEPAAALEHYERVLERGEDAAARFGAGLSQLDLGSEERAMANLSRAMELDARFMQHINDLAWRLATAEDGDARHPHRAVQLAELVDAATGHHIPEVLDTLAAAYAANRQFELAIGTLEKALSLLGEPALVAPFEQRLALYRSERPYTAPPAAGVGAGATRE